MHTSSAGTPDANGRGDGRTEAQGRPRVALLSVGWPGRHEVGGAARYGYRLSLNLARLVDLLVVTTEGGAAVPGAEMVYLRAWPGRFGHYYRFPLDARRTIDRLDPTLIHALGDDWALPAGNRPIVRTFMGSSLSEAKSSTGLRKINHVLLGALEHHSKRRAAVRIGIGPESYDEFGCEYLMPPVHPVPSVTGTSRAATPTVVFVGAWHGRKRGELAYEAVQSARDSLRSAVRMVVIGAPADRQNWPDDVDFVSDATDEEVARVLAEAWLLLAPSAYEGFGIPAFEALSLRTPVVASPNPGSLYLRDCLKSQGAPALTVAEDRHLFGSVTDRLTRGPELPVEVAEHVDQVVAEMIYQGSAEYLVDHVYRRVLERA